ncbi:unnamed protein product [Closterium sp. Naga37s-1]|nr:unnamed protein product [Closterium sp. Naga37s-1]
MSAAKCHSRRMEACIPLQGAQVTVEGTPVRKTSADSSASHSSRSKTCTGLQGAPLAVRGTPGSELHDTRSADSPASNSSRMKTCIALQGAAVVEEGIPVRTSSVREPHGRRSADSPASRSSSRMKTCIALQRAPVGVGAGPVRGTHVGGIHVRGTHVGGIPVRGTPEGGAPVRELHATPSADSPGSHIARIERHGQQHTAWLSRHGMRRNEPAIHCLSAAVFPTNFAPRAGTKGSPPNPNRTRMQQALFAPAIPIGAPQQEAHDNASMLQQCAVFPSSAAPVFEAPQKSTLQVQQCAVFPSSVAPGTGSPDSPSPCTRMVPLFPIQSREGAEGPDNVSVPQQCAVFPSTIAPEAGTGTKGPALPTSSHDTADPCPPGNTHDAQAHNGPAVLPQSEQRGAFFSNTAVFPVAFAQAIFESTEKQAHNGPAALLQPDQQDAFHSNTAVFPVAFAQPTERCAFPSFTCLLKSISPSWQQECLTLTPEAVAAGRKGLSSVQLQQQLLQLRQQERRQLQQQQQQQQQRDSEVHVDAAAWESDCTAGSAPSGSSEACVLHSPSASSDGTGQLETRLEMLARLARQERHARQEGQAGEEKEERENEEGGWISNAGDYERSTAGKQLTEMRRGCNELSYIWAASEDCDEGELLDTASSLLSIHGTFRT